MREDEERQDSDTAVWLIVASRPGDGLPTRCERWSCGPRQEFLSHKDLWAGYRVTVPYLRASGVIFSALYPGVEEMDLSKP